MNRRENIIEKLRKTISGSFDSVLFLKTRRLNGKTTFATDVTRLYKHFLLAVGQKRAFINKSIASPNFLYAFFSQIMHTINRQH